MENILEENTRAYRETLFLLKIQMGSTHRYGSQSMPADMDCRKDLHEIFCIFNKQSFSVLDKKVATQQAH